MEILPYILSWGSPIGIGIFLFSLLSGMGIFFWGVSHVDKNKEHKA